MGLGPSKSKIKQILQNSCTGDNFIMTQDLIQCHYNPNNLVNGQLSQSFQSTQLDITSESFSATNSFSQIITSQSSLVREFGMFPCCSVGTLSVKFSKVDEILQYTCFLINENVAVTLASNIYNPLYGEAKEIYTSFSKDRIPATRIKIMEGYKTNQPQNNLACLLYDNKLCEEHFGVKINITDQNFSLIGSCGLFESKDIEQNHIESEAKNNIIISKEPGFIPSELHQIPFSLDTPLQIDPNDEKLPRVQGGPIFFQDMSTEIYAVALLGKDYKAQMITKEGLNFLIESVNLGKNLVKKTHKNIEENKIYKLDLSRNDFGPLDIKYLSEFDLKNLVYLDLNSNSIKPQGAYFLSQGKYPNLQTLNLNFNEIGDEGISHIANASFVSLEHLFLFHNNISSAGVQSLCRADFIPNLVILSLSENPQITDDGCKHLKNYKNWKNLTILNLNLTGLTDEAVKILMKCPMPKLKKILLMGNSFTKNIEGDIQAWSLNNIQIEYDNKKSKHKKKKKTES